MDHGTREAIDQLHSRVNEVISRVTVLETNYKHIADKLSKIDGGISKVFWLVVGTGIAVVVKYYLLGGLH